MDTTRERTARYRSRCNRRIVCGIIWAIISFIVLAAAIAVTIGLATRGSGYSIAAAAVLICLAILFIVAPPISRVVVCCMAEKCEFYVVFTTMVWSLAAVLTLAPSFYLIAAVLTIVEIAIGKGEDEVPVFGLAVLATILNIVAAIASVFLCVVCYLYVCRRRPARSTRQEEETLVMKKKEVKLYEKERQEEEKTTLSSS